MNGLEYILHLYNIPHTELAEQLGIKKQNINLWVKGKQNIPKKYMPFLEKQFGIQSQYFMRELSEIEKLELQKEKLKKELKPIVKKHDLKFMVGDLVKVPVYDQEEMNSIERTIEKAKLMEQFKMLLEQEDDHPFLDTFKLLIELMGKTQHEPLLHKTIEALAHYLEVLPDEISSEPEQEEFENEIFEVFDDHNY